MNNYINIIDQVAILALIMGVVFFAGKKNLINDELSRGLSNILTNIALPTLVVSSFIISYSKELLGSMLEIFIISIIFHVVIILLSRFVLGKYNADKQQIIKFMFIFPNGGAMGVALIYGLYGQIGVLYLSIFLIPYQILFWTYGEGLFSHELSGVALKKYLNNPIIMSVIISFLNGIPLIKNICIAAEVIPTATVTVLFCEKYNYNTILASKCVLATHVLSIITIPMMLMFLRFS